jgi:two-component system sensor histidine kinase KdpD
MTPRASEAVLIPVADEVRDPALDLLSSIAHEIRTPISALAASAEMLEGADDGERARFTAIIKRQALRLNSIVEGLLESHRASSAGISPALGPLDLESLCRELLEREGDLYPGHRFAYRGAAERPVVSDARLLGIVLSNLLSNAAKYSPAGTRVTLSCEQSGNTTVIRVSDEGPGIPESLRPRLFDAGARGSDDGRGNGLGLYVARRLCDAMGAALVVEDHHACTGTTFAVVLPARLEGNGGSEQ